MPFISMTWAQYCRGYCTYEGQEFWLSEHQANILFILLVRPGYVSYSELIEFVWSNPDLEPDHAFATLRKTIHFLRKRLHCTVIHRQDSRGYIIFPEHRG